MSRLGTEVIAYKGIEIIDEATGEVTYIDKALNIDKECARLLDGYVSILQAPMFMIALSSNDYSITEFRLMMEFIGWMNRDNLLTQSENDEPEAIPHNNAFWAARLGLSESSISRALNSMQRKNFIMLRNGLFGKTIEVNKKLATRQTLSENVNKYPDLIINGSPLGYYNPITDDSKPRIIFANNLEYKGNGKIIRIDKVFATSYADEIVNILRLCGYITVFQDSLIKLAETQGLTKTEYVLTTYFIGTATSLDEVQMNRTVLSKLLNISRNSVLSALKKLIDMKYVLESNEGKGKFLMSTGSLNPRFASRSRKSELIRDIKGSPVLMNSPELKDEFKQLREEFFPIEDEETEAQYEQ